MAFLRGPGSAGNHCALLMAGGRLEKRPGSSSHAFELAQPRTSGANGRTAVAAVPRVHERMQRIRRGAIPADICELVEDLGVSLAVAQRPGANGDRKSTRLNSS